MVRKPAHECPGGCGALVANDKLACPRDWYRLPMAIRNAVWRHYRHSGPNSPGHREAVAQAERWYKENPR